MDRSESWMNVAAARAALVDADGRVIPAQITRHDIDHVVVGCDLGNSAIKLVLRQINAPQLRLFRFESIYTPAAMIRAGDDTTALRVSRNRAWSEWFWLDQGDTADGEALPIGTTAERLADPRTVDFLVGALVAALENSGWLPGDHTLWVGFGVPNEEVSRAGLVTETHQALQEVRGQHVAAERRDATGAVTTWTLTIGELVPAPQSLGSFFAWYHNLAGQPAIGNVDLVTVADLGGGHLSRFDVEIVRRPGQPLVPRPAHYRHPTSLFSLHHQRGLYALALCLASLSACASCSAHYQPVSASGSSNHASHYTACEQCSCHRRSGGSPKPSC